MCLGTLNLSEIYLLLPVVIDNQIIYLTLIFSIFLIYVFIFFKLAIFPFHV